MCRGCIVTSVSSGSRCHVIRSTFFWDFTQRILVICYRRFGSTYRFHLQGSSSQTRMSGTLNVHSYIRNGVGSDYFLESMMLPNRVSGEYLSVSGILLGLIHPWRWGRKVVRKRRKQTIILCCVKSQKSAHRILMSIDEIGCERKRQMKLSQDWSISI